MGGRHRHPKPANWQDVSDCFVELPASECRPCTLVPLGRSMSGGGVLGSVARRDNSLMKPHPPLEDRGMHSQFRRDTRGHEREGAHGGGMRMWRALQRIQGLSATRRAHVHTTPPMRLGVPSEGPFELEASSCAGPTPQPSKR